jgi:hypothetical protein
MYDCCLVLDLLMFLRSRDYSLPYGFVVLIVVILTLSISIVFVWLFPVDEFTRNMYVGGVHLLCV